MNTKESEINFCVTQFTVRCYPQQLITDSHRGSSDHQRPLCELRQGGHSLNHVVGVGAGAAGAVAAQGAVHVGGEMLAVVGNLKGALHTASLFQRRPERMEVH